MNQGTNAGNLLQQQNTALMKTWARGKRLTMADLLRHAHQHAGFNPAKMANWLDENPVRWEHYRCVADASRARRRQMARERGRQ
jgi:hypothetical protein